MARDCAGDAERRLEAAKKLNVEDCVAQTFLLCDSLFGTPSVAALSQKLRLNCRYRLLERIALNAMNNGAIEGDLGSVSFDRVPVLISHFMLGRGWRFAAAELSNKLNSPYYQLHRTLPSWLAFLYPLFRVAWWIKRRGRVGAMPVPPKAAQE